MCHARSRYGLDIHIIAEHVEKKTTTIDVVPKDITNNLNRRIDILPDFPQIYPARSTPASTRASQFRMVRSWLPTGYLSNSLGSWYFSWRSLVPPPLITKLFRTSHRSYWPFLNRQYDGTSSRVILRLITNLEQFALFDSTLDAFHKLLKRIRPSPKVREGSEIIYWVSLPQCKLK